MLLSTELLGAIFRGIRIGENTYMKVISALSHRNILMLYLAMNIALFLVFCGSSTPSLWNSKEVNLAMTQSEEESREHGPEVPDDIEFIRDVEYGTGGSRPLRLNIIQPRNPPAVPMPVVVHIHGGGWLAGNKEGLPTSLAPVLPSRSTALGSSFQGNNLRQLLQQVHPC